MNQNTDVRMTKLDYASFVSDLGRFCTRSVELFDGWQLIKQECLLPTYFISFFGKTFFISDSQLPKYFLRYIGKVFIMTEFLPFFMSDHVFRVL